MLEKVDPKRLSYFLPNIFTALNMACGFGSVLMAMRGKIQSAALLIILGSIFDSFDGRVARLTGTQSEFGEQFDSLSDLVGFGFAPSILMYQCFLHNLGRIGMALSFLFLLCGALRLARFNVNVHRVDPNFFQGVPIPCGAVALVGLVLITSAYPVILKTVPWLPPVYILIYSFLMVSTIPFASFKKSPWLKRHRKLVFLLIFVVLAIVFTYPEEMIFSVTTAYVLGCVAYDIYHWRQFRVLAEDDEEEDEDGAIS
jgi:CDP-diacylglycerol--serine O-phosphatidyltransferase